MKRGFRRFALSLTAALIAAPVLPAVDPTPSAVCPLMTEGGLPPKLLQDFAWRMWFHAQNLHRHQQAVGPDDLAEAFSLFACMGIVPDAAGKGIQVFATGSRAYVDPATPAGSHRQPVVDPTLPLQIAESERQTCGRNPALRALIDKLPLVAPEGALRSSLLPAAREKLIDLTALFGLAVAKLAVRLPPGEGGDADPARFALAAELLVHRDTIDGWTSGRDYLARTYAQSLNYVYLQIERLTSTHGRFDEVRSRRLEGELAGLSVDPAASRSLRRILAEVASSIWRRAQAGISPAERVLISEPEMYRSVQMIIPHETGPDGNFLFFPGSLAPASCSAFDVEAVVESALPWRVMAELEWEQGRFSLATSPARDLIPLDPNAGDELAESLAAYTVLLLGKAGSLARDAEMGMLLPDHLETAHRLLQKVQPAPSAEAARNVASADPIPWNNPVPIFVAATREAGLQEIENPLEVDPPGLGEPALMAHDAFRGVAVGDFDGDRRADLFVAEEKGNSRLYRNAGNGRFEDITRAAGLEGLSRVVGAYFADYDNDGCTDLYVLRNYVSSLLFRNRCDRSFEDVTRKAGLYRDRVPATGAVWFDYDNDGDLDLYLICTGDFTRGFIPTRGDFRNAEPNLLWRNQGDGTFVDVTTEAGVGDRGLALAAAATDYDNDGDLDLYVANDMQPDVLYENLGNGRFRDLTVRAGVGDPGNGMGVSVADVNEDGWMDLYITNISDGPPRSRRVAAQGPWRPQANRLLINQRDGTFLDQHRELLGPTPTGWGWNSFFLDFDNDSYSDLYIINGFRPDFFEHHYERKLLFRWEPTAGRFQDISAVSGADLDAVSRGGAFFDADEDGDLDLVVTGLHSPIFLRNEVQRLGHHWLALRLVGRTSNRDGIGARVKVIAGDRTQYAEMGNQGGGFVSSILDDLHFGLGTAASVDSIEVRWPSGIVQRLERQPVDRRILIEEPVPQRSAPEAPPGTPAPALSGQERMKQILQVIARDTADNNLYLGDRRLRELRVELSALAVAAPARERWRLLLDTGIEELRQGDARQAVQHLIAANALPGRNPQEFSRSEVVQGAFQLGLAYLRLGEQQNCVAMHSSESCILPIRGQGVHQVREPARQAFRWFAEVLSQEPDHLPSRWLLNLAAMTLGEYPQAVPEHFLVPPQAFASEEEVPRFREIAGSLGVNPVDMSGGVIADDFDRDGDLDIVTSTIDPRGPLHYFRNQGDGTFRDVTVAVGLEGLLGGMNVIQADYDNDGDLDFFVLRGAWFRQKHPNSLLRNNGDGTFLDVTFEAGLAAESYPKQAGAWADYDNDGDVDLYIGNEWYPPEPAYRAPGQLFRNNGDGTFTDVARQAGVENNRFAKAVAWGDYDGDRYPDLYVSNRYGDNRLYHNNGDGTFTDVACEAGVTGPWVSFNSWFWDFDNDGHLDLFVAAYEADIAAVAASYLHLPPPQNYELAALYRGDGKGGFRDVAAEQGLDRVAPVMGSNFGDIDNDGFLDMYLGTGYIEYEGLMPNLLFRNRGGRRFLDVTTAAGVGHLQKGHGVAFADFDNDGDQDLYIQLGGGYPGDAFANALFENPDNANHWLKVSLVGVKSNRSAIGARLHLVVREDGVERSIFRYVSSGGDFGSNPLRQEIGLSKAAMVERLEVFWPATGLVQNFREVAANQWIEITEGAAEYRVLPLHRIDFP